MTDEQQRPRPPQPGAANQYGTPSAADATQQIPVTPAPAQPAASQTPPAAAPQPAAAQPAAAQPAAAQPAAAQPAAAQGTAHASAPVTHGTSGSAGSVRTVLHVLALVLVALGISLPVDGEGVLWTSSAAWAAFAAVAALAQLVAVAGRDAMDGKAWWVGAAGAAGLLLFWTLLMLPVIATNMAFLVTMGTAAAVVAVLISPDRRI